ncbi:DIP1984 family protein [Enterococcus faecalis]
MKLAEALLLRRDLESKLTLLREEIASSAVIQEGDTLDRDIDDLLLDYETTNQEFAQLVIAINQRNAVAKIGEQETIAALEKREALRRSHAMLTATLEATKVAPRMGRNEIRMIRTIDTKQITDRLNQTAKALRELDGQIQQTNWLVDL